MSKRGWDRNRYFSQGRRGGFGGNGSSGNGQNWRGGPNKFRDQRPHQPYGNPAFQGGKFQNTSFGGRNLNQNRINRPSIPSKRLTETEIGVTEFISDHSGFNGIIKSRYSDFQVAEINLAGEVAKLTDMSIPEPPTEEAVVQDEDLLLSKYNVELLPMETWDDINKLAVATEAISEKVEVDVTGMTKEQRTKIHDAVKKAFGDAIVGSTVSKDDKKTVCFEKYRKGIRIDNRVKWVWPGEYVHFILYKENCDTMEAATRIAERLKLNNVKPSMLGYAGTKDRRGKTTQWFSLRRVEPKRIVNACRELREIDVGNFTFSSTHLKLGMLQGNRFRIALRNVTAPEDVVNKACENLKLKGFINYYGLQRFGTRIEMPTYEVGLKLLRGNFLEAINGILEVREGPLEAALVTYKQSGSAAAACQHIGRFGKSTIEAKLLTALANNERNLVQALDKVPRNTRLLYIHSYQSLVWNRCVSERVRRCGLSPAAGDLVRGEAGPGDLVPEGVGGGGALGNDADVEVEDDESDSEENQDCDRSEQDGDEAKTKVKKNKKDINLPKPKIPVKVVTQEDIDSNKYTIKDIILPLPGYDIDYPPNMIDYYKELLSKDGLTLEMRHKIKCYSMSGAYRHIVIVPSSLSWSVRGYCHPNTDLILSDRDVLREQTLMQPSPDAKYKALILTMDLPSSCYATMALREILRVDTSGDTQAAQNNYHKPDEVKDDSDVTEKSGTEDVGEKRKIKEEEEDGECEAKKVKLEVDE